MPYDYTAIDFETANPFRGSPCSVGMVKVRDGVAVDDRHYLMRPPAGHDEFSPWNVRVHGIRPDMVADAPRFADLFPRIVDFIDGDVLVAHNAAFDVSVLRQACAVDGLDTPELGYVCTVALSKGLLVLPNYKLPTIMKAVGRIMVGHHDALADARAVVTIVAGLESATRAGGLDSLAARAGVPLRSLTPVRV